MPLCGKTFARKLPMFYSDLDILIYTAPMNKSRRRDYAGENLLLPWLRSNFVSGGCVVQRPLNPWDRPFGEEQFAPRGTRSFDTSRMFPAS